MGPRMTHWPEATVLSRFAGMPLRGSEDWLENTVIQDRKTVPWESGL